MSALQFTYSENEMKTVLTVLLLVTTCAQAAEKQIIVIKEPKPVVQIHQRKDGSLAIYQFDSKGQWITTVVPQPKGKSK